MPLLSMSLIDQPKRSRARARGGPLSLTELNDRHRQIIALMVYGDKTGKAMTGNQVAEHLGMRPGYVASLLADPIFRVEFERAIQAKVIAHKPEAIERQVELMRSLNESVALGATKAIRDDGVKPNINVGVQVNNQAVSVRPGYAYRLPQPKTIDGNETA